MTLKKSNILITGGTGSFGSKFIEMTLNKFKPNRLVVFSRDEIKQWELKNKYSKFKNLEFIIGDIRDVSSISNALSGIDFVIHAAATKIVPTAESNPVECIKTNINGAINLINAARYNNIKKLTKEEKTKHIRTLEVSTRLLRKNIKKVFEIVGLSTFVFEKWH